MMAKGRELDKIGELYGTPRKDREVDDEYRKRLIRVYYEILRRAEKDFYEKRKKLIEEKGSVTFNDLFGENGILSGESK